MTEEFVFTPVHVIEYREVAEGEMEQVALTFACDFCLDSRVRWQYPCGDFRIDAIGFGSTDQWLACDHCSEMIEAGSRAGLVARSERSWVLRGNPLLPVLMSSIDLIQNGFWKHRTGERIAFG